MEVIGPPGSRLSVDHTTEESLEECEGVWRVQWSSLRYLDECFLINLKGQKDGLLCLHDSDSSDGSGALGGHDCLYCSICQGRSRTQARWC